MPVLVGKEPFSRQSSRNPRLCLDPGMALRVVIPSLKSQSRQNYWFHLADPSFPAPSCGQNTVSSFPGKSNDSCILC